MKQCNCCKETKPLIDFNKNKTKPDGLQNRCRACSKLSSNRYYVENKEKHRQVVKGSVEKNKEWFKSYKSTLSCVECGEDRSPTLEFHHTDPSSKEYTVSQMIRSYSQKKIMSEINKCIVLCANCHRMVHYELDRQP